MKRLAVGVGLAVVVGLAGLAAHAGCHGGGASSEARAGCTGIVNTDKSDKTDEVGKADCCHSAAPQPVCRMHVTDGRGCPGLTGGKCDHGSNRACPMVAKVCPCGDGCKCGLGDACTCKSGKTSCQGGHAKKAHMGSKRMTGKHMGEKGSGKHSCSGVSL